MRSVQVSAPYLQPAPYLGGEAHCPKSGHGRKGLNHWIPAYAGMTGTVAEGFGVAETRKASALSGVGFARDGKGVGASTLSEGLPLSTRKKDPRGRPALALLAHG